MFKNMRENELVTVRNIIKQQLDKYSTGLRGDGNTSTETTSIPRQVTFDKLTAVQEFKRAAIERYCQKIAAQALNFSENPLGGEVMRKSLTFFPNDRSMIFADEAARMKREFHRPYAGAFTDADKEQNEG